MKLRNLFFIAAACAGLLTACSNEIEMDELSKGDNTEVVTGEAYATFSFVMPSATSTRAGETVDGSSEENNISNVNFLLYNKTDGKLALNSPATRADFTPTSENGATRYTLKNPVSIAKAGTYSVHVVLNPATPLVNIETLDTYNAYIESVAPKTGKYCTDNEFMMTNADPVGDVAVSTSNTKASPALITVKVERLAAKVTFNNAGNTVDIMSSNSKIGSIKFDAYKVINTRNSAFKLKRVGASATDFTIGAPEAEGKYVIENFFAEKANFTEEFFEANYSRKMTKYVAFRNLNETGVQNIAYALENTHKEKPNLEKGSVTGVVLRGKVTLYGNTLNGSASTDGTFYKYNGKYYSSLDIMENGALKFDFKYDEYKVGEETKEAYTARIAADKKFLYEKFRIELFAQGYAYYYYWLRHINDGSATNVGPMEYVMVRNNVYQLKIKSVSGVGEFESGTPGPANPNKPAEGQEDVENNKTNPEIPGNVSDVQEPNTPVKPVKPTDPVIETDMYLDVEILVNPWTVRNNDIDL